MQADYNLIVPLDGKRKFKHKVAQRITQRFTKFIN